jgi:hypothetical protein
LPACAVKSPGSTGRGPCRRGDLRLAEGRGIPGGAVKCVEIRKNTDGEGSALDET